MARDGDIRRLTLSLGHRLGLSSHLVTHSRLERVKKIYELHTKDLVKTIPDDLPIAVHKVWGRGLPRPSSPNGQVKESNNLQILRGHFESPLNLFAPSLLPPESRRASYVHIWPFFPV